MNTEKPVNPITRKTLKARKEKSHRLAVFILSLVLAFTFSFGITGGTAFADEYGFSDGYQTPSGVLSTEAEVLQFMRNQMVQRNNNFTITVPQGMESLFTDAKAQGNCLESDLFKKAFAYTGNPKEGDYLRNNMVFASVGDSRTNAGTTSFDIYVAYFTELSWENTVDREIASVLSELNVYSASDYEKICAVHDYITKNITYDYAHVDDNYSDYYPLQYTAYGALTKHTVVCKGYALLFQRLMTELGIESYCISSGSMNHAWNVVRLGSKFYYVDVTWDTTENTRNYLLRGTSDFKGHKNSDDEYSNADFANAHPRAKYAYADGDDQTESTDIAEETESVNVDTESGKDHLDILGYAPKLKITTVDGKTITTRSKNNRGLVLVYGMSDCPFTKMMAEEINQRAISGVDIYFCVDDTKVPSDYPKLNNAKYCVRASQEDYSIYDFMESFELESGNYAMWVSSPSFYMINAKNQIVCAEHGYVENFDRLIEEYLGVNAPKTISGTEHTGNHDWELTSYIRKPTETKEGKAEYTCTKCGKIDIMVLPNLKNEINGKCGDNVTWSFNTKTGTLTIDGKGRMWDYITYPDDIGWVKDEDHSGDTNVFAYITRDKIKSVVINEGVTSVGGSAFDWCPNLRSVTIPKSVTGIGNSEGYPGFDPGSKLKTVYYGGSKAQWSKIKRYFYTDEFPDSKILYNTNSCSVRLITGTKTYKASDIRKGAKTFNIIAVRAHGNLTYTSQNTKYVKVTSNGKVTLKKGTPKGTYKIKVAAKKDGDYSSSYKMFKIVVK